MATNFYTVLGVDQHSTTAQIRERFLELARRLHPDRFRGGEKQKAEEDFQEITEAFNILTNPERRRQHDLELAQPAKQQSGPDPEQLQKVYLQRGVKAYREKNFFAAADSFHRATQADPKSAKAWYHLALACNQNPSWADRALDAARRACDLDRMNASYFKLAGRLLAKAGQSEEAQRYLTHALKWGDDDPVVKQMLDQLKRAGGKKGSRLFGKA